MIREFGVAFVLISIGVGGGIYLANQHGTTEAVIAAESGPVTEPHTVANTSAVDLSGTRIAELEAQVDLLVSRVEALEAGSGEPGGPGGEFETLPDRSLERNIGNLGRNNSPGPDFIIAGLVKAGLDQYVAEDIVQRQSQVELKRLELRDAAIRDGTIGTRSFRDEMNELRQQEISIRDEVDDKAYDRYLFHTGQPNRIAVDSVIMGSAADQNGIQAGDVIVRYENQRVYNHRDLRSATTGGERDEFVNVTVARKGGEVTMSIPRGPLGVRLSPLAVDPDNDS